MPNASKVLGFSVLLAATSVGCAKDIKPTGPVITPFERGRDFAATSFAPARYSAGIPPLTKAPVLPFMGFGLAFDVDIALGLKHDDLDMIEVGRLQTKDGPLWVVLETDAGTKEQVLLAAVDDLNTWMPELPFERKSTRLVVQDRTTTDGIDISVTYDNTDNLPVEMEFEGQPAEKAATKRNGNPLGKSSNTMLALLDIASAESLFKADVRIDDERVRARKLGGFLPFQYTLTPTVGGLATGDYFQQPLEEIPFDRGAEIVPAGEWVPAPPPPPEPVIPAPMNPATEEVVILPMTEWTPLDDETRAALLDAQQAKIASCIDAGVAANPDYAGVVGLDFYVKAGKTWEVTVDPQSTGAELVFTCAQTIAAAYTFEDVEVEGSIRVVIGRLPDDHEPKNDLEAAFLEERKKAAAEAAEEGEDAEEAGEGASEEAGEGASDEVPAGETPTDAGEGDLPEDGDDLLADEEPATMAAPLATFDTVHTMPDGTKIAQRWDVERVGGRVFVTQVSDTRTLAYEFLIHGEDSVLELRSIQVIPWGQAVPATSITFSPALPDLRRPFNGKVTSKFVIDVGGQKGFAVGTAVASFGDAGAKVVLEPSAPEWAAARPLTTTVNFKDGMAYVSTRRSGN